MKKVNIDAKETDKKNVEPLLEGELENAAGGCSPAIVSRWVCLECGAHGRWNDDDYFLDREKSLHIQRTGHSFIRKVCRLVEGPYDPYED